MTSHSPRKVAGYCAAICAFAFAAVSAYWGFGGTAGLSTLGGQIEEMARAKDPLLLAVNWVATVLKVLAGFFALALILPWGLRLPRWIVIGLGWFGALVLILYGAVQTLSVLLIHLDIVTPAEPVSQVALWWRLLVWEPWFLVLGLLWAITLLGVPRRSAESEILHSSA